MELLSPQFYGTINIVILTYFENWWFRYSSLRPMDHIRPLAKSMDEFSFVISGFGSFNSQKPALFHTSIFQVDDL
jgi:hypothetical protein